VLRFLLLVTRLQRAGSAGRLVLPYFLIHFFYGGLLLILLTAFFWSWSGMASLGALVCVFIGPVVLLAQAWWLYGDKDSRGFTPPRGFSAWPIRYALPS
jgi:hypothetical protein